MTLAEAARTTGLAERTLRRWLAKGEISGHQVPTAQGRWLVPLAAVQEHARHAGRAGTRRLPASPLPESHLPVPIEACQAALAQLAHLHQAGQQLAKAREQAANAETTAAFLREHQDALRPEVSELRQRLDEQAETPPAGRSGAGGGGRRPFATRSKESWYSGVGAGKAVWHRDRPGGGRGAARALPNRPILPAAPAPTHSRSRSAPSSRTQW